MQYQYTQLPTSPRAANAAVHTGSFANNGPARELPAGGDANGAKCPLGSPMLSPKRPSTKLSSGRRSGDPIHVLEVRAAQHAKALEAAKEIRFKDFTKLWTIHPHASVFGVWNPVMMLVIFMDTFVQPFRATFNRFLRQRNLVLACTTMSSVAWIMYVLDTVLQLFIQVPRSDGAGMRKYSADIMKSYLRSADFRLDLVTLVPWHVVHEFTTTEERVLGITDRGSRGFIELAVDLLPIVRLFRLGTFKRLTYRYRNMFHVSFATHTIIECGFGFVLCLHILACLWSLVGLENPTQDDITWIRTYWSLDPKLLEGNSDDSMSIYKPTPLNVYLAALYWALATTTSIGYGDVVPSPVSVAEQLVCIFLMCIAAISWSVIIANAVELVKDMHQRSEQSQKTMDQCESVFKSNPHLTQQVKESIREYFKKSYELDLQESTQALIGRMSPMLQRSVVQEIYAEWIEDVPWISGMSGPCLVRVVLRMENFLYVPGEVIADSRMTSFVHLGTLFIGGRILVKGDSWGVDMTLQGFFRQRESGFAMNFVSTLGLTNRHLADVLEDFPEDAWMVKRVSCWMAVRRRIRQIAKSRGAGRNRNSLLLRAMTQEQCQGDAEFVTLSDDTRYISKHIHMGFEGMQETLRGCGLHPDDNAQQEAKRRQEALEAAVQSNSAAIRSMESRFEKIEGAVGQILGLLQERTSSSPANNKGYSSNMFSRRASERASD